MVVRRTSPASNPASRSPRRTVSSPTPPSTLVRSLRARDGTNTDWPSASTVWPGRSRTASRNESVATSRRPPCSAESNTPGRIGRASSLDAAGTTCRNAAASSVASSVTASPVACGNRGNSSTGNTRSVNSERPAVIRACSPSTSTSTAPGGSDRTTSDVSRAGRTATPSVVPLTPSPMTTAMVSSRSWPVRVRASPCSSVRMPDSTGSAPPRLAVARPAVPRASTRTSRSHRNFTPSLAFSAFVVVPVSVVVVGAVDCGPRLVVAGQRHVSRPRCVPRLPQVEGRAREPPGDTERPVHRRRIPIHSVSRGFSTAAASRPSVTLSDGLHQPRDLVVDLAILGHQRADLLDRVDHRGVVAAAELPGDVGVRQVGQLPHDVHGDLPRRDQWALAVLAGDLVDGEPELLRGLLEDQLRRDRTRLVLAQEVGQHLRRPVDGEGFMREAGEG